MTGCRISDYDDSLGSIYQRRAVEFGVRDPAREFFNIVFQALDLWYLASPLEFKYIDTSIPERCSYVGN